VAGINSLLQDYNNWPACIVTSDISNRFILGCKYLLPLVSLAIIHYFNFCLLVWNFGPFKS